MLECPHCGRGAGMEHTALAPTPPSASLPDFPALLANTTGLLTDVPLPPGVSLNLHRGLAPIPTSSYSQFHLLKSFCEAQKGDQLLHEAFSVREACAPLCNLVCFFGCLLVGNSDPPAWPFLTDSTNSHWAGRSGKERGEHLGQFPRSPNWCQTIATAGHTV